MYKMVVSDLDGTLLNSKKQLSDKTIQIIKELQKKDIFFVMATGRLDVMTKAYVKQIPNTKYVVGCDGAMIRDMSSKELIYSNEISSEVCKKTFDICKESGLSYYVFAEEALVGDNPENERLKIHTEFNKNVPEEQQMPIVFVDDLKTYVENHRVYKIVASHQDKNYLDEVAEVIKAETGADAIRSGARVLGIKQKGVSKADALIHLTESLGIDMKDVVAFGDEVNDIEMLKAVGYGVAMGNADDGVKACTNHMTRTNDKDGVAVVLEQLF